MQGSDAPAWLQIACTHWLFLIDTFFPFNGFSFTLKIIKNLHVFVISFSGKTKQIHRALANAWDTRRAASFYSLMPAPGKGERRLKGSQENLKYHIWRAQCRNKPKACRPQSAELLTGTTDGSAHCSVQQNQSMLSRKLPPKKKTMKRSKTFTLSACWFILFPLCTEERDQAGKVLIKYCCHGVHHCFGFKSAVLIEDQCWAARCWLSPLLSHCPGNCKQEGNGKSICEIWRSPENAQAQRAENPMNFCPIKCNIIEP